MPNRLREQIHLREVIESKKYRESTSFSQSLGKTIDGLNYVTDLTRCRTCFAGATGTGKSVGVNSLVVSILYKTKPDEVKFIMVDPDVLSLGFADIPHLATPSSPIRTCGGLPSMGGVEMERRYKELAGWGVRNIDSLIPR